ncbi:hypothetical protein BP5796_01792 [Coleophoma crateriformis]|uniref:DJ-1/PfpI domain-containing protein n=1 Tax=Coleophoma crateriformis TaxID=565419 RepID=A0A3D8T321_9HELO|nr:hypothetical protein BP5796_01792 [Coleophoma crateriformis]
MTSVELKPVNVGFVLFPGFQALDAFGPLDALNILSTKTKINLSILAATLDPVSTRLPGEQQNPFGSNCAQSVVPTHTFDNAPDLDVLFIPGGIGRREPDTVDQVSKLLVRLYPSLQSVITICTGAAIAAIAGILDGKKATTNKKSWSLVTPLGPKTHWVANARWVRDGKVWTGAGVSAGIDVTLAWIEEVWGEDMATDVTTVMEYNRAKDPSQDPFAPLYSITDVINGEVQPS